MADKLDWLNKHLVLLRYTVLMDVVEKEGYKIRPDLAELFVGVSSVEAMVFKFANLGRFKCACELMAYIAHRRAAVWWGYRCVLSLTEELTINPAVERDIADIGASLEPEVPDFAKVEPPQADPEAVAEMNAQIAQIQAEYEKMKAMVDPEILKLVEDANEIVYQEFEKEHGIHPIALLKKLGERINEDPYPIDKNSPIFQEAAKLKAQLGAVQKETVDTIKSVIPPKVPAHEKKVRYNALTAAYRWVASPDAENSQKCLDVGNECPDTPAGLLCLSAFWAFGNLMPMGEQVVPTPPGLAANGLSQVLLLCALHQGGTRKLKERYEKYFRLGVEVLIGADNWGTALVAGKAPHEEIPSAASLQAGGPQAVAPSQSPPDGDKPGAAPPASAPLVAENGAQSEPRAGNGAASAPSSGVPESPAYKRWKPNGGTE